MRRKNLFARLTALGLVLSLLVLPAGALSVEQARELLAENYVDPIDPAILDKPTVGEILDALADPYTQYLGPQEYADFLATMEDETLVGIGVVTGAVPEGLLVSEVVKGSPAQAAGLAAGDVLVAADGVSLVGLDTDRAVELIRGEAGTVVEITYIRQGARRRVTIRRDTVVVPATTGQVLEGAVGYIDCDTWGEDTLGHFRELMEEMEPQVGCWLIDLRENVGGLTSAATDTAGLFCPPGTILSLRYRSDDPASPDGYAYEPFNALDEPITQKPVVILTDGYTASSSEAFAAALRDYGVAVTVGGRTYGKGVAQGLWDKDVEPALFADGDCMKITMARFYSPLGNTNDTVGVLPDFPADDDRAADMALALARELAARGEGCWAWAYQLYEDMVDAAAFDDCQDSPYAAAISALAAHALVEGTGDGKFSPEMSLSRAQLAQMLCNALNSWIPERAPAFDDVAEEAWYADAVAAISAQGFMEGTGSGRFSPEAVLTHQELITVVGRLARWLNDAMDLAARQAEDGADQLHVLEYYADWAKPSAWLLSCAMENRERRGVNLLWAEPEEVDPTAPATRQEAAQLLYNLLSYLGILT